MRWLRTLNRPRWTERLLRPEVKFASVETIFFKTSRSLLKNWNPKQHCQYIHSTKHLHCDFFGRSDVSRFPNCEGNVRQLASMGSMGCDGLGWKERNIQRMLQTFPACHGMTCWRYGERNASTLFKKNISTLFCWSKLVRSTAWGSTYYERICHKKGHLPFNHLDPGELVNHFDVRPVVSMSNVYQDLKIMLTWPKLLKLLLTLLDHHRVLETKPQEKLLAKICTTNLEAFFCLRFWLQWSPGSHCHASRHRTTKTRRVA